MLERGFVGYRRVLREGILDLLYGLTMKGIESFLILYLTGTLLFSDKKAFEFLGAKSVIYYSVPFLLAFVSQRFLSVHATVLTGFLAMGIGCALLSLEGFFYLALGVGFLTCGYGLGRPAIPLLLSETSLSSSSEKEDDMRYLYAFGNLSAILGPLLLSLLGTHTHWKGVFITLSGVCLSAALFLFVCAPKEKHPSSSPFSYKKGIVMVSAPFLLSLIVHFHFLKWILTSVTACGAFMYMRTHYVHASRHTRLILQRLFLLGPSIVVFFIFQSQEFFLMPLYIERFVEKDLGVLTLHTPWFHILSALVALGGTPLLSRLTEKARRQGRKIRLETQIVGAFGLLFAKFLGVSVSTHMGAWASLGVGVGYVCSGFGILLLVPTAYQVILKVKDLSFKRSLLGTLYLMMVFAYLGTTVISQLASPPGKVYTLTAYQEVFYLLTAATFFLFAGGSFWVSRKFSGEGEKKT